MGGRGRSSYRGWKGCSGPRCVRLSRLACEAEATHAFETSRGDVRFIGEGFEHSGLIPDAAALKLAPTARLCCRSLAYRVRKLRSPIGVVAGGIDLRFQPGIGQAVGIESIQNTRTVFIGRPRSTSDSSTFSAHDWHTGMLVNLCQYAVGVSQKMQSSSICPAHSFDSSWTGIMDAGHPSQ